MNDKVAGANATLRRGRTARCHARGVCGRARSRANGYPRLRFGLANSYDHDNNHNHDNNGAGWKPGL